MKTYIFITVLILNVVQSSLGYFPDPPKTLVKEACENNELRIDCPAGKGIRVVDANYGRFAGVYCGSSGSSSSRSSSSSSSSSSSASSEECIAPNSLLAVQTKCQGKRWCKLPANDAFFGDYCKGASKYLRIHYTCDYPIMQHKFVCQGEKLGLDCKPGHVIKIDEALYGRVHGKAVCKHNDIRNYNCKANALSVVKNKCEGKTWCSIQANSYTFGNPCRGTYKYLFVRYYCKKH